ncbi:hypothetical protein L210DRAFT_3610585 [Boletus edulis BED1]|uniref:Uncharacterized protein n=1 Tax=Boletus edulis BED1 TaxID=1328754 RepID=A0AAD4C1F3_BOLED|nr:hypothetical protein L210DRAFT_3610585 [Boletus edulis BED1]
MSYLSTITWLHKTFTTRQRTAELLRPELDEHILSPHDYELATRFLPGPSIDWHLVYGAGTSAAVYGYGSYLARPKWNIWRLRLGSVAAFLIGSTYGTFQQFVLHHRFANSLDNPQGFILALNHVDERLGGSGQIGFAFQEMLAKKPEIKPDLDHTSHPQDVAMVPEGWARDHDNTDGDVSRSDPTRLRTRWDEVRAANARSFGQSSWDTIRQRHERSRLPHPSGPPTNSSPSTEADDRTAAQAKFDALLEAERRRDQSHGDRA